MFEYLKRFTEKLFVSFVTNTKDNSISQTPSKFQANSEPNELINDVNEWTCAIDFLTSYYTYRTPHLFLIHWWFVRVETLAILKSTNRLKRISNHNRHSLSHCRIPYFNHTTSNFHGYIFKYNGYLLQISKILLHRFFIEKIMDWFRMNSIIFDCCYFQVVLNISQVLIGEELKQMQSQGIFVTDKRYWSSICRWFIETNVIYLAKDWYLYWFNLYGRHIIYPNGITFLTKLSKEQHSWCGSYFSN